MGILRKLAAIAALSFLFAWQAAPAAADPSWRLTPNGWGPVRLGMTRQAVDRLLGAALAGDIEEFGPGCQALAAEAEHPGMFFVFSDNRLATIGVTAANGIRTPRAIAVDSTLDEVRRAYGPVTDMPRGERGWSGTARLQSDWTEYGRQELVYWIGRDRGVRFMSEDGRTLSSIEAGNEMIMLDEGCA